MGGEFTLGPWKIDGDVIIGPDEFDICWVSERRTTAAGGLTDSSEMEANARLIAAAPDLLAALEKFTFDYLEAPGDMKMEDGPLPDAYQAAIDAIARAIGEP